MLLRRYLSRSISSKPKFLLYSGGIECSLCETAKDLLEDLEEERKSDFGVEYVDIRKAPPSIRRLYQYEIPVLTLDSHHGKVEIKNRMIQKDKVSEVIEAWYSNSKQEI